MTETMLEGTVGTYMGYPVRLSPFLDSIPRFVLSDKVPVSDEYRAKFNAWAKDFFGTESVVLLCNDLFTGREYIAMGNRSWEAVKKHFKLPAIYDDRRIRV